MARAAFMALAEMSISGTKISSHLKRSPTTAMPGTSRFSMIQPGSSPSARHCRVRASAWTLSPSMMACVSGCTSATSWTSPFVAGSP